MIEKERIMDTRFYYLRDLQNKPLVTVCLAKDTTGQYYRGIAICSPKDNPVKRVGRQIALGRVLRALHRNIESDPVFRSEACYILREVQAPNPYYIKSTNDPILTPIEIKLIKGEKK